MQGFEAERLQDLGKVLLWYELQLSLLNEEDRRLPQLLLTGPIPERYLDSSLDELRRQFAQARELLRHAAMLHMLTTAEALVRVDFEDLSRRRINPKISRRFRRIGRERGKKIRLHQDILDTWVEVYPETARSIRQFKDVLRLRDWLAHGRYWNLKIGRPYEVSDVFDIASEMLSRMEDVG
ncbi:MAG: hypothetical protein WD733_09740 [Bryobacterales bacterium]